MNNDSTIARRKLLKFGAVVMGTGLVTKAAAFRANATMEEAIALDILDENSAPEEVLEELLAGNQRFVEDKVQSPNRNYLRLKEVSQEQTPLVCIMSCADSRVPIEIIFDRGFGDLFIVRNAGNVATPEEIGSLEYGTVILGSKVLMVLGHESCGAVTAALDIAPLPGQMGSIVAAIQPAIDRASQNDSKEFLTETVKRNVILQVERLTSSPLLYDLVQQGKLKIVGAYYSLQDGTVTIL